MVVGETNAPVIERLNRVREEGPRLGSRIGDRTWRQRSVVDPADVGPVSQSAHVAARDRSRRVNLVLNAKVELVRIGILDVRIIVPVHATGEKWCRWWQTSGDA